MPSPQEHSRVAAARSKDAGHHMALREWVPVQQTELLIESRGAQDSKNDPARQNENAAPPDVNSKRLQGRSQPLRARSNFPGKPRLLRQ